MKNSSNVKNEEKLMINHNLKVAVGIDIGHSNVKHGFVFSDLPEERHYGKFPTVVIDYFRHESEDTRKEIEKNDMVELNGKKYFFGKTAQIQGTASTYTGQEIDWINTIEHDVLILGAWKRVQNAIKEKRNELPAAYVVLLGLPTKFYSSQKNILEERVEKIITPLLKEGQKLKIIIKAQSEAPLSCLAFNETGLPSKVHDMSKENWGIIEVGFKTADFSVWYDGQIVSRLSDSTNGAFIVYEYVDKKLSNKYPTNSNGILTKIIEDKQLFYQSALHDLSDVVEEGAERLQKSLLEKAKSIFSEHKDLLHGIIIAGGATSLIFDAFKEKYPNTHIIPGIDPQHVVLESFLRIGLFAINVKKVI